MRGQVSTLEGERMAGVGSQGDRGVQTLFRWPATLFTSLPELLRPPACPSEPGIAEEVLFCALSLPALGTHRGPREAAEEEA